MIDQLASFLKAKLMREQLIDCCEAERTEFEDLTFRALEQLSTPRIIHCGLMQICSPRNYHVTSTNLLIQSTTLGPSPRALLRFLALFVNNGEYAARTNSFLCVDTQPTRPSSNVNLLTPRETFCFRFG